MNEEVVLYQGSSPNNIQNTWIGNIGMFLTRKLKAHPLDLIPEHLRIFNFNHTIT
jgi:hypothetical protein